MVQTLKTFFKLIRWPNLLIIILAQVLINYLLIGHILKLINVPLPLSGLHFFLLVLSTVAMAAFGYIFNDINDVDVDRVNKDNKQIIGNHVTKKAATKLLWAFLLISLLSALVLTLLVQMWQLFLIHVFIAVGLWYYSVHLKGTIIFGNLVISLFSALSIAIVWVYHLAIMSQNPTLLINAYKSVSFISYSVAFYAAFAFIISWIREMIKDVEDQNGDALFGWKTFVIKFGEAKTKVFIQALLIVMIVMLIAAIFLCYTLNWGQLGIYLAVAVGFPLFYLFNGIRQANSVKDFHDLSNLAKIIMIAGILSIQLFNLNYGS